MLLVFFVILMCAALVINALFRLHVAMPEHFVLKLSPVSNRAKLENNFLTEKAVSLQLLLPALTLRPAHPTLLLRAIER